MENVWSIRENKDLYYILPEKAAATSGIDYADVAVIAYIYYEDTVEKYLEYLKNIPDAMAVYLISSNENTLKALKRFAQGKKNIQVIRKENRGRDVSALVISGKEIFQRHEYVCFVHDKKAKSESDQEMVRIWIENLWGNTLQSAGYIENVLKLFADNPGIGLLVPPEPYYHMRQMDFWDIEYERTKALAEELGLTNTVIEKEYPPITIGTVFWCRTYIMKKLFDREWRFGDFVAEPMPAGGTISHAVERIFAYIAQDAGSETATIMTTAYAKKMLALLQHEKKELHGMLDDGMGKKGAIPLLWELYARKEQISAYIRNHEAIYLFGAGEVGKRWLIFLQKMLGCSPKAFLVTDRGANEESVAGIPVYSLEAAHIDRSAGIIISTGKGFQDEIKRYLESRNYNEYLCIRDLPEDALTAVKG